MPRNNSSTSAMPFQASRKASIPVAKSPIAAPVPSYTSAPTVTPTTIQLERPGFFSNMWTGFGLGAGQSIAANIFRSPTDVIHTYEVPSKGLKYSSKEFVQCMEESSKDFEACKHLVKD